MANVLALDLTGQLPANRVSEIIDVGSQGRVFPLGQGSFFTNSVSIKNTLTHVLLRRDVDYKIVEQDVDAQRQAVGHDICKYIYLISNVPKITVDYQAIGGIYQFNGTALQKLINDFVDSRGQSKIVGLPQQYAPSPHIQNINDFNKLGSLLTALTRIGDAITNGKSDAMVNAMLNYTEDVGEDLRKWLAVQIGELESQLEFLTKRNDFRDGRYYINSSATNPAAVKGGAWTLENNVMLYGAVDSSDVGTYENIVPDTGLTATLKHLWRRNDFGSRVVYNLTATATEIDEGGAVTFNLVTEGLPTGTSVPYYIRGIQATDIAQSLEGVFILDSQGKAKVTIDVKLDYTSEGTEVMTLILSNAPSNSVSVVINDTSLDPTYNLFFSTDAAGASPITSINETSPYSKFYIQIRGAQIPEGNRIYLLTDGSTADIEDFVSPVPVFVDIFNSTATLPMEVLQDYITEGDETLIVNLCTEPSMSSRVVSASLTIKDTSVSATYNGKFTLAADGTGNGIIQANEGTVVYYAITTTNVPNGTTLNIEYAGNIDSSDFVNVIPSTVIINNNRAIIQYSIKADLKTEGDESFIINLRDSARVVATNTLTILDSSINQSIDVWWSSNVVGTDRINSIMEGEVFYIHVKTVGVANGTILKLNNSGTATADDFDSGYVNNFDIVVNNNSVVRQYKVKADRKAEGLETLVADVTVSNLKASASINIQDTSTAPGISLRWSSNANGSDIISSVAEGRSAYLIIQTTNMINNDRVTISYSGTASEADFSVPRATTATITNNRAVVEYSLHADSRLEGTENMFATVKFLETQTKSERLDILDTSIPPKLKITAFVDDLPVREVYAGQIVKYVITDESKQLASNATIYVSRYNSSEGESVESYPEWAVGTDVPSRVTLSNWTASFTFKIDDHPPEYRTKLAIGIGLNISGVTVEVIASSIVYVDLVRFDVAALQDLNMPNNTTNIRTTPYFSSNSRWYTVRGPKSLAGKSFDLELKIDGVVVTGKHHLLKQSYTLPSKLTFDQNGTAWEMIQFTREFIPPVDFPILATKDEMTSKQTTNIECCLKLQSGIALPSSVVKITVEQSFTVNKDHVIVMQPGEFITLDMYGSGGAGGGIKGSPLDYNKRTVVSLINAKNEVLKLSAGGGGDGGDGFAITGKHGIGGQAAIITSSSTTDWYIRTPLLSGNPGIDNAGGNAPAGDIYGHPSRLFAGGLGEQQLMPGSNGGSGSYIHTVIYNSNKSTLSVTIEPGLGGYGNYPNSLNRPGMAIVTRINGATGTPDLLPKP